MLRLADLFSQFGKQRQERLGSIMAELLQAPLNIGNNFTGIMQSASAEFRLTTQSIRLRLVNQPEADIDIRLDQLNADLFSTIATHRLTHNKLQFAVASIVRMPAHARRRGRHSTSICTLTSDTLVACGQ